MVLRTIFFLSLVTLVSCQSAYLKSVGGDPDQIISKIYQADFQLIWEASLDVLKTTPLDTVNREVGMIETAWIDNRDALNLLESAGNPAPYNRARYRLKINVSKGFYEGKQSTRVVVKREQQVLRDVLEGYVPKETDGVAERTLLYRVGRIAAVRQKIQMLEEERLKEKDPELDAPVTK
jgi:hypothetical protein